MDTVTGGITTAVDQQAQATREITGVIARVAAHMNQVAERAAALATQATDAGTTAQAVEQAADALATDTGAIDREVQDFLAYLKRDGDARRFERFDVVLPAEVVAPGITLRCETIDLSEGGVCLRMTSQGALAAGMAVTVRIEGVDMVGRIAHLQGERVGVALKVDAATSEAMRKLIAAGPGGGRVMAAA
jgi:hypothetical protein